MNEHKLLLKQTSEKLEPYKGWNKLSRPKRGWVFAIRQALGISTTRLAKKLGVNQSVVSRLEKSERNNNITLKSLQTIAEALDCTLVYALIPKTSLENTIKCQAKKIAKERLKQVSHHMMLEDQGISKEKQKKLYDELLAELLSEQPKKLWRSNMVDEIFERMG